MPPNPQGRGTLSNGSCQYQSSTILWFKKKMKFTLHRPKLRLKSPSIKKGQTDRRMDRRTDGGQTYCPLFTPVGA